MERLSPEDGSGVMQNFGLKFITDVLIDKIDESVQVDKNRFKTLKKHCRKLYQKLKERLAAI